MTRRYTVEELATCTCGALLLECAFSSDCPLHGTKGTSEDRRRAEPSDLPTLPTVAGDTMERSTADFTQACLVFIADEQAKPAPDNALIAVLCDAVRLGRERAAWIEMTVAQAKAVTRRELLLREEIHALRTTGIYTSPEQQEKNRIENRKHNHPNLPGRCDRRCPEWVRNKGAGRPLTADEVKLWKVDAQRIIANCRACGGTGTIDGSPCHGCTDLKAALAATIASEKKP